MRERSALDRRTFPCGPAARSARRIGGENTTVRPTIERISRTAHPRTARRSGRLPRGRSSPRQGKPRNDRRAPPTAILPETGGPVRSAGSPNASGGRHGRREQGIGDGGPPNRPQRRWRRRRAVAFGARQRQGPATSSAGGAAQIPSPREPPPRRPAAASKKSRPPIDSTREEGPENWSRARARARPRRAPPRRRSGRRNRVRAGCRRQGPARSRS